MGSELRIVPIRSVPLSLALSPRQLEILELIAIGMTDKELALRLGVSPSTVHTHLERMLRRFGLHSRSALVALWLSTLRHDEIQQVLAEAWEASVPVAHHDGHQLQGSGN